MAAAARTSAIAAVRAPPLSPDVGVVNGYAENARLGMHVDRPSGRHPCIPVVAISLGDDAEFSYKRSWKRSAATQTLLLRSGDVLVFGGRRRGLRPSHRRGAPRAVGRPSRLRA